MLKNRLSVLKGHILTYNTYFNVGFDNVYADEKGIRNNEKAIFPADNLGDYFYLRLNNGVRFANTERARVSDCATPAEATMSGYCIACVRNADADMLIDNLVNTMIWNGVAPTGALWNKEEVIKQEMRVMKSKDMEAALARVDRNYTIVSVSFDYRGIFNPTKLNCLENPCKCSG